MSRILVIDDNALISQLLKDGLTEQGYEVRVAFDANQGFILAQEFSPDLILLDVQLPDATGFDLCRIIKNHPDLKSVPIIMITGSARSTEEKVKGFQLGIDDYLTKPFEWPELQERVRAILRRTENRSRPVPKSATSSAAGADPARMEPTAERIPVSEAIQTILISPQSLPAKPFVPGISLSFLMLTLALCMVGCVFSAGVSSSLVLLGFKALGLWGLSISVLVMTCSLAGISLKWKEGAGLISLAASPLLLKFAGALVLSLCTTLSPFYYSAGLTLVWKGAPVFFARLDAFEMWSVVLLGMLLTRWSGAPKRKSWVITLLVWGSSAALVMAMAGRINP